MKNIKINYDEIMALGFKEKPMQDDVYERQNGYPYVLITKKLTKKIYLEWEKETKICKIVRLKSKKTGDIANTKVLTLNQVKEIIEFFGKAPEKSCGVILVSKEDIDWDKIKKETNMQ